MCHLCPWPCTASLGFSGVLGVSGGDWARVPGLQGAHPGPVVGPHHVHEADGAAEEDEEEEAEKGRKDSHCTE